MAIRFALWLCLAASAATLLSADGSQTSWPGWRGATRDGHALWLPQRWQPPVLLWSHPLPGPGVGGVAATDNFIVVSGRDAADESDLFVCLDPFTGQTLWELSYPESLRLDYGNSPRATPTIADPLVYLLGAGGQLTCVDLDSGEAVWKRHLVNDLGGERPTWGYGGSPLLVGNRLILQPGGTRNPIVALDASNGELLWSGPAQQTGYAAPQIASWSGKQQIVGFDQVSLSGWDLQSGQRLWSIRPPGTREFHVPMPLLLNDAVITSGENRGTLLYKIDPQTGTPSGSPNASYYELAPDMHSPLIAGSLLLGVHEGLHALDVKRGLKPAWVLEDPALTKFCSLIATDERLLVLNEDGELLLIDLSQSNDPQTAVTAEKRILGRVKLGDDIQGCLAHPALLGDVLLVRGNRSLQAWSLAGK